MTAKVWFTRLPESLDIPDLGGLQVELLSGAVMTRADAASRSLEVQTALNAAGVHDFTASIDERTGITNVLVNPDPLSISDVLGRLPVHLVTDPKLIFEWTSERVTIPQARGGGGMDADQYGTTCTTAFTVTNNYGITGVLSAGHCTDHGLEYWFTSTTWARLYEQSEYVGDFGDFGWYTVAGQYPEFYAHHYQVRDYTGGAYAFNGMNICNYGRASDRDYVLCAEVVDDFANTSFSRNMVRTARAITIDGDSGGPWYAYNTGYGVHYGFIDGTSSFSQVHYIDDALAINTLKS